MFGAGEGAQIRKYHHGPACWGATRFRAVGPCAPRGTALGPPPSRGTVQPPGERRHRHLSVCRPAAQFLAWDSVSVGMDKSRPWDELRMISSMA